MQSINKIDLRFLVGIGVLSGLVGSILALFIYEGMTDWMTALGLMGTLITLVVVVLYTYETHLLRKTNQRMYELEHEHRKRQLDVDFQFDRPRTKMHNDKLTIAHHIVNEGGYVRGLCLYPVTCHIITSGNGEKVRSEWRSGAGNSIAVKKKNGETEPHNFAFAVVYIHEFGEYRRKEFQVRKQGDAGYSLRGSSPESISYKAYRGILEKHGCEELLEVVGCEEPNKSN